MIFITVGTQLPFDRLISAVDQWVGAHPEVEAFAQIGPSEYRPQHLAFEQFITPAQVDAFMQRARVVVAHAGMGSVLTALQYKKPIVILPRIASLREHRNDHQLATARWLERRPGVYVARDEGDVAHLLDRSNRFVGGDDLPPYADGPLIDRLRAWIAP